MASLINNLAEEYSSTKSYIVGDVVTYDNKLYLCIEDTSGIFNISSWQEKYIADLVKGSVANSNLVSMDSFKATSVNLGFKPSQVLVYALFNIGNGKTYFFDNAKDNWSIESYTGTGGATNRGTSRITLTDDGFTTSYTYASQYDGFYYIAIK